MPRHPTSVRGRGFHAHQWESLYRNYWRAFDHSKGAWAYLLFNETEDKFAMMWVTEQFLQYSRINTTDVIRRKLYEKLATL